MNNDMVELAKILADWASLAPKFTIYLFGSRVRGDNRPDSDVDVVIRIPRGSIPQTDCDWWVNNNNDHFKSINSLLPGLLKICESVDPIAQKVVIASNKPMYRDRNVVCVWLPPKTNQ